MTNLTDNERILIWAISMNEMNGESCSISKSALRDAINAVDDWVEDNSSSFNSAIPQPARGALTTRQKIRLLRLVLMKRYEVQ
jgi:hypothetical protein